MERSKYKVIFSPLMIEEEKEIKEAVQLLKEDPPHNNQMVSNNNYKINGEVNR